MPVHLQLEKSTLSENLQRCKSHAHEYILLCPYEHFN